MYTIHMHALFSNMLYHWTLNTVPCAVQEDLVYPLSLRTGYFAAANPKLP